jgi:hypothetical protein
MIKRDGGEGGVGSGVDKKSEVIAKGLARIKIQRHVSARRTENHQLMSLSLHHRCPR